MRKPLACLAAAFGLLLASATAHAGDSLSFEDVEAGLKSGKILLIDVREADEFAAGHVPGALNRPLSALTPLAVPKPDGQTVVVMCRSGSRSAKAAALLSAAGRSDIAEYPGSMNEWTRRGAPTVQGQ